MTSPRDLANGAPWWLRQAFGPGLAVGRPYLMLIFVAVAHIVQGVALLWSPAAAGATPVAFVVRLFPTPWLAGVAFVVVGLVAVGSVMLRWSWWCVLPQQGFLILAAFAACQAMWLGKYADGTAIPSAHIVADQLWVVLAALFHPIAVYMIARR